MIYLVKVKMANGRKFKWLETIPEAGEATHAKIVTRAQTFAKDLGWSLLSVKTERVEDYGDVYHRETGLDRSKPEPGSF